MVLRAAMLFLLAALGGAASAVAQTTPPTPSLPAPPVPPRIAQGPDYDRCLQMLTTDPQGAAGLAETWAAAGGGDGAAHCRALAQIALGNAETGAQMLETLAGRSTAPDLARASVYGQAVQAWLMASRPDRALAAATLALRLAPDNADLLVDRAVAAGLTERYQAAVDDLDRALAIDPRRVEALVLRAAAWRRLGQLDLARDDIDRALLINADNAEALLERGILRQRAGDAAGARADWQRAITLDPDSTTADLAQQNLALLEAGPRQ